MRWTCLLVSLFVCAFVPAHAGHSPPKVVFHIHVQTNIVGLSAQEATTIAVPPNGEQIQVRTLPEVTEQDIIGVAQENGRVRIQLDHTGTVALSAVTAQNQGRILVVTIDGYIVYAPIIDEQITSGEIDIPKPLPPQIVSLLQDVARQNVRKANKA